MPNDVEDAAASGSGHCGAARRGVAMSGANRRKRHTARLHAADGSSAIEVLVGDRRERTSRECQSR